MRWVWHSKVFAQEWFGWKHLKEDSPLDRHLAKQEINKTSEGQRMNIVQHKFSLSSLQHLLEGKHWRQCIVWHQRNRGNPETHWPNWPDLHPVPWGWKLHDKSECQKDTCSCPGRRWRLWRKSWQWWLDWKKVSPIIHLSSPHLITLFTIHCLEKSLHSSDFHKNSWFQRFFLLVLNTKLVDRNNKHSGRKL